MFGFHIILILIAIILIIIDIIFKMSNKVLLIIASIILFADIGLIIYYKQILDDEIGETNLDLFKFKRPNLAKKEFGIGLTSNTRYD